MGPSQHFPVGELLEFEAGSFFSVWPVWKCPAHQIPVILPPILCQPPTHTHAFKSLQEGGCQGREELPWWKSTGTYISG